MGSWVCFHNRMRTKRLVWLLAIVLLFRGSQCTVVCPAQGVWRGTPRGQRAILPCNELFGVTYYSGFSYRLCSGTERSPMWGEVVSNCTYLPLLNLTYPLKPVYRVGDPVFITPVYSGYADSWAASPPLPSSVHLDKRTGVLRGAFSAALEGEFTITASNQRESTAVILHCRIRDTTRVTLQVVPLSHAPRSSDNPLGRILSTEGNQIREGSTVLPPSDLHYPISTLVAYSNVEIDPLIPVFQGEAVVFFSQPRMPSGLLLDTDTGIISGKAVEQRDCTPFLIGVRNEVGSSSFPLQICVFEGEEVSEWDVSNNPKAWFWYALSLCVLLFVAVFVFAVLRCACTTKRR